MKLFTGFLRIMSVCVLVSSSCVWANSTNTWIEAIDPIGDVDHNLSGCPDLTVDIVKIAVQETAEELKFRFTMSRPILRNVSYREYYVWIDAVPSKLAGQGYSPYSPESQAWRGFFADYRVFLSLNANNYERRDIARLALQNCELNNCAIDEGLLPNSGLSFTIDDATVALTVKKKSIPKFTGLANTSIGVTTYYSLVACRGGYDFPQWGEKAFSLAR